MAKDNPVAFFSILILSFVVILSFSVLILFDWIKKVSSNTKRRD